MIFGRAARKLATPSRPRAPAAQTAMPAAVTLAGQRYRTLGYCLLPVEGVSGWAGVCVAACFLACFLACFSRRRSRSLLSRVSFAIVVFFLPVEAMRVRSFVGLERVNDGPASGAGRREPIV